MNKFLVAILFLFLFANCKTTGKNSKTASNTLTAKLFGNFEDDYGIRYTINHSLWIQHPGIKYHLLKYDNKKQYFIAMNDTANPSEAGSYSRIDIMYFTGMEPWGWGFCLTAYNAKTFEEALSAQSADRNNPKKGCNGFPFSRMKRN